MDNINAINRIKGTFPSHKMNNGWIPVTDSAPPVEDIPDHGDGDGGYVCFACGRSTNTNETFVCVSRLWLMSGEGADFPTVIDAMASVQVCIPCTLIAARQELTWETKPKLVYSEMRGFYIYAQQLALAMARMTPDTLPGEYFLKQDILLDLPYPSFPADAYSISGGHHRVGPCQFIGSGQCHNCNRDISRTGPYMRIEIAVNTPRSESLGLSNAFSIAEYCNGCSKQLFSIDDNGFPSDTAFI